MAAVKAFKVIPVSDSSFEVKAESFTHTEGCIVLTDAGGVDIAVLNVDQIVAVVEVSTIAISLQP